MKKITAFLLVLTLLVGVSAAFAEATPSKEDIIVIVGHGDVHIIWVDDDNEGDDPGEESNTTNAIRQAQAQGSALDVLPQEIRDQLPAGYNKVNEFGAMKLEGDLDNLDKVNELKAEIKFDTPYAEGELIYLALGIPGEAGTEWVLLKGTANANSNVEVTFDHDTLMKIGTKTFAVMAISK